MDTPASIKEEEYPPDARSLIIKLDKRISRPCPIHTLQSMHDEAHRLDLAFRLGQRELIEELKTRYDT